MKKKVTSPKTQKPKETPKIDSSRSSTPDSSSDASTGDALVKSLSGSGKWGFPFSFGKLKTPKSKDKTDPTKTSKSSDSDTEKHPLTPPATPSPFFSSSSSSSSSTTTPTKTADKHFLGIPPLEDGQGCPYQEVRPSMSYSKSYSVSHSRSNSSEDYYGDKDPPSVGSQIKPSSAPTSPRSSQSTSRQGLSSQLGQRPTDDLSREADDYYSSITPHFTPRKMIKPPIRNDLSAEDYAKEGDEFFYEDSNYTKALALYQLAAQMDPINSEYSAKCGRAASKLKQYTTAIAYYRKALEFASPFNKMYYAQLLGNTHVEAGDPDKAVKLYESLSVSPLKKAELFSSLGILLLDKEVYKVFPTVLTHYCKLCDQPLDNLSPTFKKERSSTLSTSKWRKISIEIDINIIKNTQQNLEKYKLTKTDDFIQNKGPELWDTLNIVYFHLGTTLVKNPDFLSDSTLLCSSMRYFSKVGDVESCDAIIDNDPENLSGEKSLAYYRLGQYYASQRKFGKAKDYLDKSIECAPDSINAILDRALLSKSESEKRDYTRKAHALFPKLHQTISNGIETDTNKQNIKDPVEGTKDSMTNGN